MKTAATYEITPDKLREIVESAVRHALDGVMSHGRVARGDDDSRHPYVMDLTDMLTAEEAVEYTRKRRAEVSPELAKRWTPLNRTSLSTYTQAGYIPAWSNGRRLYYRPEDLDAFCRSGMRIDTLGDYKRELEDKKHEHLMKAVQAKKMAAGQAGRTPRRVRS